MTDFGKSLREDISDLVVVIKVLNFLTHHLRPEIEFELRKRSYIINFRSENQSHHFKYSKSQTIIIYFVDYIHPCQTIESNPSGPLSRSLLILSVIYSSWFRSRSCWRPERVPRICHRIQLLHESGQKKNILVSSSLKTCRKHSNYHSMNLLNSPSITTNIPVSRTFSNPIDPSLKDNIPSLSKMFSNIIEIEN